MNDEFEELELIGRGSFGQIRKVKRKSNGQILVRKEISYKTMNSKEKDQLLAEFRILKGLKHPNIVQYFDRQHLSSSHQVHLYMEYCGGGDLAGLIRQCRESNEYVPENIVWSIFTQLILALYRCHFNTDPPSTGDLFCLESETPPVYPSTVILHRDIKPDNVFLDAENNVKLGDFGLAKMLDQDHLMANTYVGTPYYMSPEVLMDQPYTPQSDIWSLGCVIYELCTLHPPFQAKSHLSLSQKIREGTYPALPEGYSTTLNKTIAACINVNPIQRPTTDTLLKLDVIKLCRRERELREWSHQLGLAEEELFRREQILMEREHQMAKEFDLQRQSIEQEIYAGLENNLSQLIDKEVEHRLELLRQDQNSNNTNSTNHHLQPRVVPTSPSDTTMGSVTPGTAARNVRGPRSIKDNIISPLKAARQLPFDELAHNHNIPASPLSSYSRSASGSSASSETSATSAASSNYTSNWQTTKKDGNNSKQYSALTSETPQRAAPHYNIVHSSGTGLGAAVAKARIMGIKAGGGAAASPSATPGAFGRATTAQLQHDKEGNLGTWDEQIYGDDMPSPFLRRWERRVELNNRSSY